MQYYIPDSSFYVRLYIIQMAKVSEQIGGIFSDTFVDR